MRESSETPPHSIPGTELEIQPLPPPSKLRKLLKQLQTYSGRWWYLPLMGIFIFLDLFVVVIPSEAILIKTVMLRPSRWIITPLVLILCSAIGAVALASLIHAYGEPFITWLVGNQALQSTHWLDTKKFIDDHGGWAMAFISLGPLPQQPGVVLCGLAGMKFSTLFWAVFLGRAPKYFFFAYLARHAPKLFVTRFKKFLES